MKNKIIQTVAEGLLGELPRHKGPFVSNAEARRCANFDNQKRFDLAEAIATRITEQLGECYVECELKDVLIGQPILEAKQGVRTSDKYATFPNDYEGDRVYLKKLPPHPKDEPKDSAEEDFIVWQFFAYKSEEDYEVGNYYFMKSFDDHAEMKMFSARHSAYDKKLHPNYCSTYEKITRPTNS